MYVMTITRETNQEEGEDNASDEEPFAHVKRDGNTSLEVGTVVEDLVGPRLCRQHGYCSEDIGYVDQEALEDEDVEPEISAIGVNGAAHPGYSGACHPVRIGTFDKRRSSILKDTDFMRMPNPLSSNSRTSTKSN